MMNVVQVFDVKDDLVQVFYDVLLSIPEKYELSAGGGGSKRIV
jgi:hypothetical protein